MIALLWIAIGLGLASVDEIGAQAPIRCLNNWRDARFTEPLIQRMAADITADCADSSRIEWNRHLAEIRQAISAWAWDANMTANLRKLEGMLQQEQAHLLTEKARPKPAPSEGGPVPVGNDWSLDNTISERRPITGLSEIQRKWEEDKRKTLRAFKAIGGSPAPTANTQATVDSPPTTPPAPIFRPVKPADSPARPQAPRAQDPRTAIDPDLAVAIGNELIGDGSVVSEATRLAEIRQMAPLLRELMPPAMLTRFTNAARAWALLPNRNQNAAWDALEALRQEAIEVFTGRPFTAKNMELRMSLHDPVSFEAVVIPAAASLGKPGGGL